MREIFKNVKEKLVGKYLDDNILKKQKNLNLESKLEFEKISNF